MHIDSNLGLRLGDSRFQILQRQFQLRRIQFLGFRPELRAPIILNLVSQLLDQRLRLCDEGLFLGNHRLLMLARSALEEAATKLIYLAIRNFEKGGRNVREWFSARNQFAIMFDERFNA